MFNSESKPGHSSIVIDPGGTDARVNPGGMGTRVHPGVKDTGVKRKTEVESTGAQTRVELGGKKTLKKRLPKSVSLSDVRRTEALKKLLKRSIMQHKILGFPHTLGRLTTYDVRIPDLAGKSRELRDLAEHILLDQVMRRDLEDAAVINFCRTIQKLYALKTAGDGNCLLHAVSMALWGFHDKAMLLRRLVYISLVEDTETKGIYSRWERERRRLNEDVPQGIVLSPQQWSHEWSLIVEAAEDLKREGGAPYELPYESLEEIHIFVLANVIQRPIIVLAEGIIKSLRGSILGPSNFGGIYLPLLWDASKCTKTPIVLGYHMGHFTPLVNMVMDDTSGYGIVGEYIVPLVNKDIEPLHIHFLSTGEEKAANRLLQQYLRVVEVNWTKRDGFHLLLSAKLEHNKIENEYDLMSDFIEELEKALHPEKRPETRVVYNSEHVVKKTQKPDDKMGLYLGSGENSLEEPVDKEVAVPGTAASGKVKPTTCTNQHQNQAQATTKVYVQKKRLQRQEEFSSEQLSYIGQSQRINQQPGQRQTRTVHKCIKIGCDYYGSREYGGYCYQCFLNSTKAARAPPQQPDPSEVFEYHPTLMDERCAYMGPCTNMASTTTYPYCHEHAGGSPQAYPGAQQPALQQPAQIPQAYPGAQQPAQIPQAYPGAQQPAQIPQAQASGSHQRKRAPVRRHTLPRYEASITDYQCNYRGCKNAASINCFPYCNHHRGNIGTAAAAGREAVTRQEETSPTRHRWSHPSHEPSYPTEPESVYPSALSITPNKCAAAECTNRASKNTFPYCHEHEYNAADQDEMGPSLYTRPRPPTNPEPQTNPEPPSKFQCQQTGCRDFASFTTFPFCEQHHIQRMPPPAVHPETHRMAKHGSKLVTELAAKSQERTGSLPDENIKQAESDSLQEKSHSLGSIHGIRVGRSQPCPKPGCTLYGPPATGYYCMQHVVLRKLPPGKSDPTEVCSNPSESETPVVSSVPSRSETPSVCTNPGCGNMANPMYKGICSNCFLMDDFTDELVGDEAETRPEASEAVAEGLDGGTADRHEGPETQQQPAGSDISPAEPSEMCNGQESERQEEVKPSLEQQEAELEQPTEGNAAEDNHCPQIPEQTQVVSEEERNVSTPDHHNQHDNMAGHHSNTPDNHSKTTDHHCKRSDHHSNTPNDHGKTDDHCNPPDHHGNTPEQEPDVGLVQKLMEGSPKAVRPKVLRCVGPECPNPGNPKLRGLCDVCYTALSQIRRANLAIKTQRTSSKSHKEHLTSSKPHGEQPISSKSHKEQPTSSKPYREQPTSSKPYREHLTSSKPHGEQPESSKSHKEHLTSSKPYGEQPTSSKSHKEQQIGSKPYKEQPESSKPHREQPESSKSRREQPAQGQKSSRQPESSRTQAAARPAKMPAKTLAKTPAKIPAASSACDPELKKISKATTLDGATELSGSLNESTDSILPCISEGCDILGSAENHFYCSKCYENMLVNPPHPVLRIRLNKKPRDHQFILEENSLSSGIACCQGHTSSDSVTHTNDCPYGNSPVTKRRTEQKSTVGNHMKNANNIKLAMCDKKNKIKSAVCGERMIRIHSTKSKTTVPSSTQNGVISYRKQPERKDISKHPGHTVAVGDTVEALHKIENSVRTSVRHCKTKRCQNFGNPTKKGFCNSCYARVL